MSGVAVIILNHNKPENSDILFNQLKGCFDLVEIWDSGSSRNGVAINTTRSFHNIFWTGCWNRIIDELSCYDAVWMIGCDITLNSGGDEYYKAIRKSLPFGCWSPCIEGRAHPFMLAKNYKHSNPISVKNIEGMAMALSGEFMKRVGGLVDGSEIGFGQDYWLCYRARKEGFKNIIDGRVSVYHPEGIGYNEKKAHDQMEIAFTKLYGKNFRRTIFDYDERYEGNLLDMKEKLTMVTVDGGWGVDQFCKMASKFSKDVNPIIMQKGLSTFDHLKNSNIEVWKYDRLDELIDIADIAYFPKVSEANEDEYRKILESGVAMVVDFSMDRGLIENEVNGFHFANESWASSWIKKLIEDPSTREKFYLANKKEDRKKDKKKSTVAIITPTYNRDERIVKRSIDCLLLQSFKDWRQVICSNGKLEPKVAKLVCDSDDRVEYTHCVAPSGDFGNYARKEMLEKVSSDYVMFFDDDNIILPNYLEEMVKAIESGDYDYAVCQIMHFGPLNEKATKKKPPVVLDGSKIELYHIDTLQFLVKASVMKEIGWDTSSYISDGITLQKLNNRSGVVVNKVLGVHV